MRNAYGKYYEKILDKWNLSGPDDISPGDYVEVSYGGMKLNAGFDLGMPRTDLWKELGWPELYNPKN